MCAALTLKGAGYSRIASSLAEMPGKSRRRSMMVSAVWVSTSFATGTGWYGEPFQHSGGGGASVVPQLSSRSEIFFTGRSRILASRLTTSVPPSGSFFSARRSTVTTTDVRFDTSGRPAWSMIRPRTAGSTTSRTVLLAAAAL